MLEQILESGHIIPGGQNSYPMGKGWGSARDYEHASIFVHVVDTGALTTFDTGFWKLLKPQGKKKATGGDLQKMFRFSATGAHRRE